MKICLTLSGEPREYKNTFYTIKRFKEKYNVDVFIHAWNSYTKPGTNDGTGKRLQQHVSKQLQDELNDIYEPIWVNVQEKETLIDFLKTNPIIHNPFDYEKYMSTNYGSICQWYSSQEVNRMKQAYEKQEGFKYDIQIKTRFDTFFIESEDYENLYFPQIQKNITDVFVGWLKLEQGQPLIEYATIIGSNTAQDLIWHDILLNITSCGNFGQTNPHTQLYNYFRKLKLNVDDGELVKKICRNLIRPTINGELLKKYFDNNDNDKCIEIIKKTYLSYT